MNTPPDDILQHLNTINRHLRGLTVAFEALERAMLEKYAPPRTDGERAAQAAREVVCRQGASEVKVIRD